jgi:hypothetical protein
MPNFFEGADFIFEVKISSPKFLITYQMVYLKLPAGSRKLVTSATNKATFVKKRKENSSTPELKCTCHRMFYR